VTGAKAESLRHSRGALAADHLGYQSTGSATDSLRPIIDFLQRVSPEPDFVN